MKLKYSPESVSDLERLYNFVALKSPLSARKIAIELQQATEKLKLFSQIGLPVSRAENPELVRDLYVGNYTIRYLISSEELIFILRVWHNKEIEKDL
jgi:toxin ParE1/3/4